MKAAEKNKLTKNRVILMEQGWLVTHKNDGCQKCQAQDEPTLDHIIPIDLLRALGMDPEHMYDEENFQVLCRRCNHFKGRNLDHTNPKTKVLLRKYVDVFPEPINQNDSKMSEV